MMVLFSPTPTLVKPTISSLKRRVTPRRRWPHAPLEVVAMAKESSDETGGGVVETAAIIGGLVSTPVIGWSLYTLKTTGCVFPPGPDGSIGAAEGVSYLAVVGIVGRSLYTKAKTRSCFPNGPFGLLGAVEERECIINIYF